MEQEFYTTALTLRIDWGDLDYFGHVNNVSFYKYIQAARVNFWDCIGLTQFHKDKNIGPLLASCACEFKRPLYYPGTVRIFSKIAFIGNTSFGLQHKIVNESGDVAAEAKDAMVMFDFNAGEKVLFPEFLKEAIRKLESND